MTARNLMSSALPTVNAETTKILGDAIGALLALEENGSSTRDLERATWETLVLPLGRAMLQFLLTLRCLRVARAACDEREVSFRLDSNYTVRQSTTLGQIEVPLFAYREGPATLAPARAEVFPLLSKCHSSDLLLEWEARLGCTMPFRQAEEAMDFFSHGAARIEDTTINRHIGMVAALLDHTWTCRTAEAIAEILTNATRDKTTGRPILYFSSDAHALRRYKGDTWTAEFKMINGIRIWCVDRRTGETVHLGGAYTWGDCREVAALLRRLVDHVLPDETTKAAYQVVFLSDGIGWIRDHLFPAMPAGTLFILDLYHVLEHLGVYAATRFGKGSAKAKEWVRRAVQQLIGKRSYTHTKGKVRKGHKKKRRRGAPRIGAVHLADGEHGAGENLAWRLIEEEPESEAVDGLTRYLAANSDRTDYPSYRARGLQIGSGAMESFHRVASQVRLKLAGARWTAESAMAVLNTRLLLLAKRWGEFWGQRDLALQLRSAFDPAGASDAAAVRAA